MSDESDEEEAGVDAGTTRTRFRRTLTRTGVVAAAVVVPAAPAATIAEADEVVDDDDDDEVLDESVDE